MHFTIPLILALRSRGRSSRWSRSSTLHLGDQLCRDDLEFLIAYHLPTLLKMRHHAAATSAVRFGSPNSAVGSANAEVQSSKSSQFNIRHFADHPRVRVRLLEGAGESDEPRIQQGIAKSAATAILIEHLDLHRVVEPPNHLDGTLGFETHERRRAEECERRRGYIQLLTRANEEQHRVSALLVVDKILSCFARLARLPLSFPMQQFTTDGIVLIHRARRKLLLGFLKCDQCHNGFDCGAANDSRACFTR